MSTGIESDITPRCAHSNLYLFKFLSFKRSAARSETFFSHCSNVINGSGSCDDLAGWKDSKEAREGVALPSDFLRVRLQGFLPFKACADERLGLRFSVAELGLADAVGLPLREDKVALLVTKVPLAGGTYFKTVTDASESSDEETTLRGGK